MKMSVSELKEVMRLHQLWLNGDPAGKRANLRWADLSWADLSGANLSGAERDVFQRWNFEFQKEADAMKRMLPALKSFVAIAEETRRLWEDAKVGKMLKALAGWLGYRADIDAIHEIIEQSEAVVENSP